MDFDSFARLDRGPLLSELFHHFLPNEKRLVRQLINPLFRLFLELVESKAALDDSRLRHQEFQVGVGDAGLVRPPVLLDHCRCQNRALLPFEKQRRDLDSRRNLVFVDDAVIEVLFLGLLEIHVCTCKHCDFTALNVGHFDL